MAGNEANTDASSSRPRAGIEREVRELHALHAAALNRYASAFARSPEGAPDAVQEVFLRYFIERSYGREIDNPRAWLYRVLHNYLLDSLKSVEARADVALDEVESLADRRQDPEASLRQSESARQLAGLLSPREFECLSLRCSGMAYEEIGSAMGLRIGTVGVLLSRACQKIRQASPRRGMAEALRMFLLEGEHGFSS